MQLEKLNRKLYILPKVESCVKLDLDFRLNTPMHSMANKHYQGCYPKTTRSVKSDELMNTPTMTTITISSGKRIKLYAPMQESKRAQRLKNVPYELQYFQTKLPTKNFKSSHLMSEDLLNQPGEQIDNQQKWQMRSHINKMNKATTSYQIKRGEKNVVKQTQSTFDLSFIKQQNEETVENEKLKVWFQSIFFRDIIHTKEQRKTQSDSFQIQTTQNSYVVISRINKNDLD